MWKDSDRNIVVIFQTNILRIVGFYVRHSAKEFQTVYKGEIWCLCTVTFGQNISKLNSRPVYYSQIMVDPI